MKKRGAIGVCGCATSGGLSCGWRFLWIVMLLITLGALSAGAEEVIGEWVDTLGSFEQKIVIFSSNGTLYRRSTNNFGGKSTTTLREVSPASRQQRRFEEMDSCCQQFFAINSNGDLDLYDEDGFIRTARRGTASIGKPAPQRGSSLQRDKDGNLHGRVQVGGIQFEIDAHEGALHVDYDAIAFMVARVRIQGYRCDSVNQVLPFIFGGGITLSCNGFRYKYEFEDHGGRITMKVLD